ncbi:MAG TPA: Mth938-like domain-containing protein [Allosphingosinicella sp.]|nr:Mth938-like domain-containing protein [Allosphingosinicella sp.]
MPRWDRDAAASGPVVQGLSARGFTIDGGIYEALFLTPSSAHAWRPPPLAELDVAHLEPLLGLDPPPEFLLLGTGPAMAFPPRTLVRALEARGIGIEAMDSRAAARTWGMLRAEERWIVAAIMPL